MFPDNAVVLPILGVVFSLPCFWVIVTQPTYAPSSRFVLLTLNLTLLYSFNIRDTNTEVESIAFHRSVAVAFGVAYGLLISRYIWPYEARRELRHELSRFLLNTAFYYQALVKTYTQSPLLPRGDSDTDDSQINESSLLLEPHVHDHLSTAIQNFVSMELYLQMQKITVRLVSAHSSCVR